MTQVVGVQVPPPAPKRQRELVFTSIPSERRQPGFIKSDNEAENVTGLIMEVTESKKEGLSREFKVAVPAADVEEKIVSRLKKMAKSARIPGFRPGKVPVQLLRQRYGDALKGEVIEEAVQELSSSVMTERGLRSIGQPKIELTSFEDGGNLEYTLAVDLFPEFELPDFSKIELERLVAEVDDEEVDKTLERLADAHKTSTPLTEPRTARTGDTVVFDFVGSVDGEKFEGGSAEGFELELGSGSVYSRLRGPIGWRLGG